ncbi:hypothetical protein ZIOFF_056915 [Zingiber officinale]|uniref:FLZ-type domain-containing protein n=1 Tax=Zingiber officinale TaxID=94328 RepID=A0A8J5FYQ0_ZINOF|nr:hypothetical protein ZIOFF_056915 [Zingiber officinale]
MLLGKRPRPPIEPKTSSMEFPDGGILFDVETHQALDQDESIAGQALDPRWVAVEIARRSAAGGVADWCSARLVAPMLSPRGGVQRRNPEELSGDHLGTASFLRACGLCHRRLGPGRDAFMYRASRDLPVTCTSLRLAPINLYRKLLRVLALRKLPGEIAFCSLECRQQHMNMDVPSAAQEP